MYDARSHDSNRLSSSSRLCAQDGEELYFGQRFTHYFAVLLAFSNIPLAIWAYCIVYAHNHLDDDDKTNCDKDVYSFVLSYAIIVTLIFGLLGLYALYCKVTGKEMKRRK